MIVAARTRAAKSESERPIVIVTVVPEGSQRPKCQFDHDQMGEGPRRPRSPACGSARAGALFKGAVAIWSDIPPFCLW